MKQGQDEFNKRGRAEWLALIDEWIHSELDRKLVARAYLDDVSFERIAEENQISVSDCIKRVKKARAQLFSHIR
jgi:predicted DNA-binding protein YlxM (UPF0122 family)